MPLTKRVIKANVLKPGIQEKLFDCESEIYGCSGFILMSESKK